MASATPEPQVIHTDGSCLGNGRAGAVAAASVWFGDDDPRNMAEPLAGDLQTNQRAELRALVMALFWILGNAGPEECFVVRTDSRYSINCVTVWVEGWKCNGWLTSKRKPVLNRDLVEELYGLMKHAGPRVSLEHVRGHAGVYGNEQADALCNGLAREIKAAQEEVEASVP